MLHGCQEDFPWSRKHSKRRNLSKNSVWTVTGTTFILKINSRSILHFYGWWQIFYWRKTSTMFNVLSMTTDRKSNRDTRHQRLLDNGHLWLTIDVNTDRHTGLAASSINFNFILYFIHLLNTSEARLVWVYIRLHLTPFLYACLSSCSFVSELQLLETGQYYSFQSLFQSEFLKFKQNPVPYIFLNGDVYTYKKTLHDVLIGE